MTDHGNFPHFQRSFHVGPAVNLRIPFYEFRFTVLAPPRTYHYLASQISSRALRMRVKLSLLNVLMSIR